MRMYTSFAAILTVLCFMFLMSSGTSHAQVDSAASGVVAADTTFTYQGWLVKDGEAIDGQCDFRFTLFG